MTTHVTEDAEQGDDGVGRPGEAEADDGLGGGLDEEELASLHHRLAAVGRHVVGELAGALLVDLDDLVVADADHHHRRCADSKRLLL